MFSRRTSLILAALLAWGPLSSLAQAGGCGCATHAGPAVTRITPNQPGGPPESVLPPGLCSPHDTWFVTAETLLWSLDSGKNQAIVQNLNTRSVLLRSNEADLGLHAAPRISFGRWIDCDTAWEVTYYGFDHWNGEAAVTGNNDLRLVGDLGLAAIDDFFGADIISIFRSAEFHSTEINILDQVPCTEFGWIFGIRFISFREKIDIRGTDFDASTSDYLVTTENNLVGGQLGGHWEHCFDRLTVQVIGKAGMYFNDAKQSQRVGDLGNTFLLRDARKDGDNLPFVGELGVNLVYSLNDTWSLRGGYNLLWIEGLARANDQLDFSDTLISGTSLIDSGSAFLHGTNVGIEARW